MIDLFYFFYEFLAARAAAAVVELQYQRETEFQILTAKTLKSVDR